MTSPPSLRTPLFTAVALVAFAGNSLLCRLALRSHSIDAASFSAVRLAAGAGMLALLLHWRQASAPRQTGSWISGGYLLLYAVPFSFAYVSLSAGTGALLLFGAVQLTMVLVAIRRGQRPGTVQCIGLLVAFGGLAYLCLPGITAPSPVGAALMLVAGIGWGLYSLRGHGSADALGQTAGNFARTIPLVLVVWLVASPSVHLEPGGILWALLSGAVTSGLGYAIWYKALPHLSSVTAAAVQLAVPLLAGVGGILLLDEEFTLRLAMASVLILGGIGVTIIGRARS
ncbi:MAG: DMT family transporter [Gemmatimonadales bacterium]